MKKNKNIMKKDKAITLIALVVTIIILLILAGVSVGLATNGTGLFDKAKLATEKYNNAVVEEESELEKALDIVSGREETATATNPTGSLIIFMADNAPNGYLVCNGQEISRTTYKDLFDVIGTKYGEGDGSTTFNLPNLSGKFLKGNESAGVIEEAGLPNITGSGMRGDGWGTYPGSAYNNGAICFTAYSPWVHSWTSASSGTQNFMVSYSIDASQSNPIYGKSTTVTPENISVLYCIKY